MFLDIVTIYKTKLNTKRKKSYTSVNETLYGSFAI